MSTTNPTRVVTGEVRLSYTNIFEAKSIQGGKPKYSVSVIIPKGERVTGIEPAYPARESDPRLDSGVPTSLWER
ncbi:DUF2815 family protein [Propionibacterium sp. NM47_B9-13]|jgi:hypothetical protein|uniref:Uncharacterized protein n=2 Tax=Cutibacterium modestum TaxID=2559073 RepID=A0AAD1NWN5_9ACTN|nr:ssDNA-binding protein [Cutibacterium modestum]EFS74047.1 hypothetical protein HMPREF9621_01585 [Cutibacterium modestum HL037PA2]TGY30124.1 DUF2815 family protein [Propionibacterium sp. NM47_B9-13]AOH45864.1 hypothetical protein BCB70_08060 [Cutibacterium modestum]EFS92628.1 hypothetical protein HMPREF9607_01158 [Cutibacterium modestum HL044PA1]EFT15265.1 hypothetical protein HMPREF9622_01631 [Cutibacterium modestum HL037PA3]